MCVCSALACNNCLITEPTLQCMDSSFQELAPPVRVQAGVLDPAKVTRSGMTNACSIAGIMLTTQVRRLHVL